MGEGCYMKLQECLYHIGEKARSEIAGSLTVLTDSDPQTMAELLLSEEGWMIWESRMTEGEKTLLLHLLRTSLGEAVTFRQMEEGLTDSLTGLELKAALIGLRTKGLLYAYRKLWGELLYAIPGDVEDFLHTRWFTFDKKHPSALEGTPKELHEAAIGIHYDLFHLLKFVHKHGFPLTQKGSIHKRQVQKCSEGLHLSTGHVGEMSIRYVDQDVYPRPFAIVYDLALRMGLLGKNGDEVILVPERLQSWLELSPEEMKSDLLEHWNEAYAPPRVWLGHIWRVLSRGPEGWVSSQSLLDWLRDQEIPMEDSEPDQWLKEEIFYPIQGLGWLDVALMEDGDIYVRWKGPQRVGKKSERIERSTADDQFYVQPNFELMLPPSVRFNIRWQVETFTYLKQADHMSIYELTRESLHGALEQGSRSKEILDFLEQHSMYPLPDNIRESFLQWGDQYGRIRFTDAIVMECADATLGDELDRHPKLKEWVIARLSPTHFLIPREYVKDCIRFLDQQGYAPRKTIDQPDMQRRKQPQSQKDSPATLHRKPQGIVFRRQAYEHYALDPVIPALEDVVPTLKQAPASWTKDFRPYHISTLKDVLRQAIEWKTKVRLEQKDEDRWLQPNRIAERDGHWIVEGRGVLAEEIVDLKDIGRIQIWIP
jgi:hypothetical protein